MINGKEIRVLTASTEMHTKRSQSLCANRYSRIPFMRSLKLRLLGIVFLDTATQPTFNSK
eukprot:scaffold2062_cov273-Chaetoceros_neogracile.AAC.29